MTTTTRRLTTGSSTVKVASYSHLKTMPFSFFHFNIKLFVIIITDLLMEERIDELYQFVVNSLEKQF